MLESIRENPDKGKLLIKNAEYLVVELEHASQREMVTKLDDFLRRRSKISMVLKPEAILNDPGLQEACKILFGEQADSKIQEYKDMLKQVN